MAVLLHQFYSESAIKGKARSVAVTLNHVLSNWTALKPVPNVAEEPAFFAACMVCIRPVWISGSEDGSFDVHGPAVKDTCDATMPAHWSGTLSCDLPQEKQVEVEAEKLLVFKTTCGLYVGECCIDRHRDICLDVCDTERRISSPGIYQCNDCREYVEVKYVA